MVNKRPETADSTLIARADFHARLISSDSETHDTTVTTPLLLALQHNSLYDIVAALHSTHCICL
eukprot:7742-Heterococcus_DN1.PRE.6